jgi:alkylation response protein AidB-like acyl-CoA dehydrogenase
MAVRVEGARCQLFYAATALKEQQFDAAMQIDAARLLADRAAKANTDANIQLHGGIGVTEEFNAHLLLKRANLLWRLFGSPRQSMQALLGLAYESGSEDGFANGGATAAEAG